MMSSSRNEFFLMMKKQKVINVNYSINPVATFSRMEKYQINI